MSESLKYRGSRTRNLIRLLIGTLAVITSVCSIVTHDHVESFTPKSTQSDWLSLRHDTDQHSQRPELIGWHCHSCFSTSIPVPPQITTHRSTGIMPVWPLLVDAHAGYLVGVEPPPPRNSLLSVA
jgi:hypothetical protein